MERRDSGPNDLLDSREGVYPTRRPRSGDALDTQNKIRIWLQQARPALG